MIKYFIIGYTGVIIAALAQIILKIGALRKSSNSIIIFFINIYTFTGYTMMLIVTLINLYIFKYLELKYILIFLASTYILVLLLSFLILKEPITSKKAIQYIIILLGIFIFNM